MDSNGLTREQLERFESYYFSVNHFSCTHDDARDNGHYRENYWLYDKCCKQENKELKEKLEKYEYLIQYIHDTCLCERFETEGFDYHEKHKKRDAVNKGTRPKTPCSAIEDQVGFKWEYEKTVGICKAWKVLDFVKELEK